MSAVAFEEMQRLRVYAGPSRAVADLTADEIDRMMAGRMASAHDYLNVLLDDA